MSHNIEVESGKSLRLKTAGKYCDRDIVVTATGGGGSVETCTVTVVKSDRLATGRFYYTNENFEICSHKFEMMPSTQTITFNVLKNTITYFRFEVSGSNSTSGNVSMLYNDIYLVCCIATGDYTLTLGI